ncbi:MAG: aminotransferase class III-fold pyridoxal phosphate-dependent enzyme [Symploca sp. SIO2D2]|nr:aminotransferase class III-fold pyridoxal phosphate-dependent enzyme [Symploca sp. SIO2D2]
MMTEIEEKLGSEKLNEDPQLTSAVTTIVDRIRVHSSSIDGIRPAFDSKRLSYEEAISRFNEVRGGNLYFPYIGSGLGRGPFVELEDGSVKLDFINGIGTHPFGHSHPDLIETALHAATSDTVMQGNLQQNREGLAFSEALLAAANRCHNTFQHCFLSSTGVMAGENMLKIAFQARQPASRVIAFENCFAGRTLSFSQITDKPAFRVGLPSTLEVDYVPFFDESDPLGSTERAAERLKEHLKRRPKEHAAFIYELIQGEGGFNPGTTRFFRTLMEICREHEVLNLCDEVQTFARTHSLFAFQHFALDELVDGLWIGKSSQTCATLFKSEHKPAPGLLSQTFTSSSGALAVGNRILELLTEGDYFGSHGRIARLAERFHEGLNAIRRDHPNWIRGPYGIGAMTAFTPFEGTPQQAQAMVKTLFEDGLMAFVAGSSPARVRFLWPVGVTQPRHIDIALHKIEAALSKHAS